MHTPTQSCLDVSQPGKTALPFNFLATMLQWNEKTHCSFEGLEIFQEYLHHSFETLETAKTFMSPFIYVFGLFTEK